MNAISYLKYLSVYANTAALLPNLIQLHQKSGIFYQMLTY